MITFETVLLMLYTTPEQKASMVRAQTLLAAGLAKMAIEKAMKA